MYKLKNIQRTANVVDIRKNLELGNHVTVIGSCFYVGGMKVKESDTYGTVVKISPRWITVDTGKKWRSDGKTIKFMLSFKNLETKIKRGEAFVSVSRLR